MTYTVPRARTILLTCSLAAFAALWLALAQRPELRVNGRVVNPRVAPFVTADDHLYLPVRGIARRVGGEVELDSAKREVILLRGRTVVRFRIGDRFANLNGRAIELSRAPFVLHGRTMVDAAIVSRAFAVHVAYEKAKNRVDILTPGLNFQGAVKPR